ncbi:unnamed protein product [Lathyrus sativus]|nr:unnamed protein product [Lathyrus sativus]
MAGAKRSRGRPKATVSPVPTQPSPHVVQSMVNTEKQDEEGESERNKNVGETEDENVKGETLKEDQNGKLENRKLWVDVISENWNPTKGRSMEYVTPKVMKEK